MEPISESTNLPPQGRSPWPSWLQKHSLWRWSSLKRSLLLLGIMIAMMLVFEAASLSGDTQPFLVRSAMQLNAKVRTASPKISNDTTTDDASNITILASRPTHDIGIINNDTNAARAYSAITVVFNTNASYPKTEMNTSSNGTEAMSSMDSNSSGTGVITKSSSSNGTSTTKANSSSPLSSNATNTKILRTSMNITAKSNSSARVSTWISPNNGSRAMANSSTGAKVKNGYVIPVNKTASKAAISAKSVNTSRSSNKITTLQSNKTIRTNTAISNASVKSVPSVVKVQAGKTAANSSKRCSPQTIDPDTIQFSSHVELFSLLQMGLKYPSPVFEGDATSLCGDGENLKWEYCLPISGSKDETKCHGQDQFDLMRPHTPSSLCFNSALHMMMVDVYEEMKHLGLHPALLYGTLLGAVRDGLTIPFTEDADIGYNALRNYTRVATLKKKLATKGYHMFFHKIWRVCVAPTHPLASNLYNPDMELLRGAWDAPYVDLYEMKLQNETTYNVAEASPSPVFPRDKIEPFSQVTLHGRKYDTVADPAFLLKREYGAGYMTPKSRKQRAPRTRKPTTIKPATTEVLGQRNSTLSS